MMYFLDGVAKRLHVDNLAKMPRICGWCEIHRRGGSVSYMVVNAPPAYNLVEINLTPTPIHLHRLA